MRDDEGPRPDILLHCSGSLCVALVYLDESIRGDLLPGHPRGRYCSDCARAAGYFSAADIQHAGNLLAEASMIVRPGDPRPGDRPPSRREASPRSNDPPLPFPE